MALFVFSAQWLPDITCPPKGKECRPPEFDYATNTKNHTHFPNTISLFLKKKNTRHLCFALSLLNLTRRSCFIQTQQIIMQGFYAPLSFFLALFIRKTPTYALNYK